MVCCFPTHYSFCPFRPMYTPCLFPLLCCVLFCVVFCVVVCCALSYVCQLHEMEMYDHYLVCLSYGCVVLCCVLCCVLCSVLCWGCVSGAVVSRGRSDGSSSRHGRCAIGSPTHKRSGVVLCCRMIACCVRGDRRVVLW